LRSKSEERVFRHWQWNRLLYGLAYNMAQPDVFT